MENSIQIIAIFNNEHKKGTWFQLQEHAITNLQPHKVMYYISYIIQPYDILQPQLPFDCSLSHITTQLIM